MIGSGSGSWASAGIRGIKHGRVRIAMAACALLLVGGLGGCALTTPSRAEVKSDTVEPTVSSPAILEDGVLTVAVDTTDAPQAMNGSDGTPTGYYVDVARALAQRMGLKAKIVSSASADKAISGKKADIFIGASASDVSDDLAVSDPVGEDASAVFAKTDSSQAASSVTAESMAGGSVAVQDSSASQDALARAGITAAQKTYSNVNECFEALAKGEVQYVACDATAGAYLARAYPGVSFVGIIGTVTSYGIATPDSGDLATAVSDALSTMSQDGTLDTLHATWYGGLPVSLSGSALGGVTISSGDDSSSSSSDADSSSSSSASGSSDSESEAPGDQAVATDTPITNDINSLSN